MSINILSPCLPAPPFDFSPPETVVPDTGTQDTRVVRSANWISLDEVKRKPLPVHGEVDCEVRGPSVESEGTVYDVIEGMAKITARGPRSISLSVATVHMPTATIDGFIIEPSHVGVRGPRVVAKLTQVPFVNPAEEIAIITALLMG